jgi:hypothetical protein
MFESYLRSQGLQARGGQIIDATFVPVPIAAGFCVGEAFSNRSSSNAILARKTRRSKQGGFRRVGMKTQIDCCTRT